MTNEEIKEGDIVEIDYITEFTKEHINEGKALVIWKGSNHQPLVRKLNTRTTIWTCYEHIARVVGHIDIEGYMDKALEQQPCEDCINRKETLKAFAEKCGGECGCCKYNGSGYDTAENCKLIKSMPSVTPKTSCETCREQVLKHLEKEDWADTVNCVMNMPFMKREETKVFDKIRTEIMQLDYDLESVDYDYNDMTMTEEIHMICREEVLRIIDKYKTRDGQKVR